MVLPKTAEFLIVVCHHLKLLNIHYTKHGFESGSCEIYIAGPSQNMYMSRSIRNMVDHLEK